MCVCVRERIPIRFSASLLVHAPFKLAMSTKKKKASGELFKYKSLKFAVNLRVHTERLAMLYNYFFRRRRHRRLRFSTGLKRHGVQREGGGGGWLDAVGEKWLEKR